MKWALVVALVLAPQLASAHPMDIGYLRVAPRGNAVDAELALDINAVGLLLGRDPARVGASDAVAMAHATLAELPCTWSDATGRLVERTLTVSARATCRGGAVAWPMPFVGKLPSTFHLLVRVRGEGGDQISIVDRDHASVELALARSSGLGQFVWTGIAHIGATPSEWRGWKLPDGIDHILFVLALLLAGGSLRELAKTATGFTVGHSITLALATLHVARPPASVIEPLIALSIALVAAESLTTRLPRSRWKVALAFGLIHGFGFASALDQLDLSPASTVVALFGYNLGVELGQLVIICVALPVVLLARRDRRTRFVVDRLAPLAICIAGLVWFIERL